MSRSYIDIKNIRYGKLVAIKFNGYIPKWGAHWICKCDCGKSKIIRMSSLRSGRTKSCGCNIGGPKDIKGRVFGKLTALAPAKKRIGSKTVWDCLCECGNKHQCLSANLLRGSTKSCGCLEKGVKPNKNRKLILNRMILASIKNGAKRRNLEFNIPFDYFCKLIQRNCYYCNYGHTNIKRNANQKEFLTYNGIDRINSKKGYIKGNIRACCKFCNVLKMNLTTKEFKEHFNKWVKNAYNYIKETNENKNKI